MQPDLVTKSSLESLAAGGKLKGLTGMFEQGKPAATTPQKRLSALSMAQESAAARERSELQQAQQPASLSPEEPDIDWRKQGGAVFASKKASVPFASASPEPQSPAKRVSFEGLGGGLSALRNMYGANANGDGEIARTQTFTRGHMNGKSQPSEAPKLPESAKPEPTAAPAATLSAPKLASDAPDLVKRVSLEGLAIGGKVSIAPMPVIAAK